MIWAKMAKQLSIGDAAKYIGVSRDTLRRWEKKGKILPKRSPTNRRYYTQEQLDTLLSKPKTVGQTKSSSSAQATSNPLKLVIYSLLALLAAVILALLVQIYVI